MTARLLSVRGVTAAALASALVLSGLAGSAAAYAAPVGTSGVERGQGQEPGGGGEIPEDPEVYPGNAVITGTARVGSQLEVDPGVWSPQNATLTYRWLHGTNEIATGRTYTPKPADVGRVLTVHVRGTAPGHAPGETYTTGVQISQGLLATTQPRIVGEMRPGQTVSLADHEWGPAPVSMSYQWLRNGIEMDGVTGVQYVLTTADAGYSFSVRVSATKDGFQPVTLTTEMRSVPLDSMSRVTQPRITGEAKVGSKLTAVRPVWEPAATQFAYQWYRDGAAIPRETGESYVLTPEDAGKRILVEVYGGRPGYWPTSWMSEHVVPLDIFTTTPAPKVSGTARVGGSLRATAGTWVPAPDALSYQWLRNGAPISGATKSTYAPVASDAGKRLSVRVVAVKAGLANQTVVSSTALISRGVLKTAKPKISGTAKVGKKLRAKAGSWGPRPVALKYQWKRNGKSIKGATKSSYRLKSKDRGKRITVTVKGAKSGYTTVSKTSSAKRVKR